MKLPLFVPLALCLFLALGCKEEEDPVPYDEHLLEAAAELPGEGFILAGRQVHHASGGGSLDDSPLPPDADAYLVRVAADGGTLWERSYDVGPFGGLMAVRAAADGSILGAGIYQYVTPQDAPVFLLRTDAAGNLAWRRDAPVDSLLYPAAVRPTADGGFVFAGNTEWGSGTLRLVKLDAEANVLLDRTYHELAYLALTDVRETAEGFVLLCRHPGQSMLYLIGTDALGDTLWTRPVAVTMNRNVEEALAPDHAGGWMIASARDTTGSFSAYDLVLYHRDAAGEFVGGYRFDAPASEVPFSIEPAAGGFIVGAISIPVRSNVQDFLLVRTGGDGSFEWSRMYDIGGADRATFAILTADGGYLLGGFTSVVNRAGYHACAIRTDGSGGVLWQRLWG